MDGDHCSDVAGNIVVAVAAAVDAVAGYIAAGDAVVSDV